MLYLQRLGVCLALIAHVKIAVPDGQTNEISSKSYSNFAAKKY